MNLHWTARRLSRAIAAAALVSLTVASAAPRPTVARDQLQAPEPSSTPDRRNLNLQTFDAVWLKVRDTHFDAVLSGVDWEALRRELRPRAEAAVSDTELRGVLNQLLDRLGQSHFAVLPRALVESPPAAASDASGSVGLDARLIAGELIVTRVDSGSSAAAAGVRPGWIVQSIADADAPAFTRTIAAGIDGRAASLHAWAFVSSRLRGAPTSVVRVTFKDADDRPVSLALERRREPGEPVRFGLLPTFYAELQHRRLEGGGASVGAIAFNIWMPPIAPLFDRAIDDLRDTRGVIIDLRGNVGGAAAMIIGIAGHFFDDLTVLGTMRTRDTALKIVANPRRVDTAGRRVIPYRGAVAIITDALTLSASEVFAGGMQAVGRARVFGERTAGQALPATVERLPNGDIFEHAFAEFVTASGQRLEHRGVVPDEEVSISRADLLAGRDAPLLAAARWIQSRKKNR